MWWLGSIVMSRFSKGYEGWVQTGQEKFLKCNKYRHVTAVLLLQKIHSLITTDLLVNTLQLFLRKYVYNTCFGTIYYMNIVMYSLYSTVCLSTTYLLKVLIFEHYAIFV